MPPAPASPRPVIILSTISSKREYPLPVLAFTYIRHHDILKRRIACMVNPNSANEDINFGNMSPDDMPHMGGGDGEDLELDNRIKEDTH